MLAKFRAYGGRINIIDPPNQTDNHKYRKSKETQVNKGKRLSIDLTKGDNVVTTERRIDCLDPLRHQRIAVLFSSFSYESENHPSPCVYPWYVSYI